MFPPSSRPICPVIALNIFYPISLNNGVTMVLVILDDVDGDHESKVKVGTYSTTVVTSNLYPSYGLMLLNKNHIGFL